MCVKHSVQYLKLLVFTITVIIYFRWYLTFLRRKNPVISYWFLIAPPRGLWCLLFSSLFPCIHILSSTQQWWLTEHLLWVRHLSRRWKDHGEQVNKIPALKGLTPGGVGAERAMTQGVNKTITDSDTCSKEIKKANQQECDGDLGERPLKRWPGRPTLRSSGGKSLPGIGRADAKSSSQD